MIIKCKKIISPLTNEDLGEKGAGLTVGKSYLVLVLSTKFNGEKTVTLRNDDNDNIGVYKLSQFEIVDNRLSSYWKLFENELGLTFCPEEWSAPEFWENLDDGYSVENKSFEKLCELMTVE